MKQSTKDIKDIKDELIKRYSKESDFDEARGYVNKVLAKLGIYQVKPALAEYIEIIEQLTITYATYKRAFYESRMKGDKFWKKYEQYEVELRDLTVELIRKSMDEEKNNENI